MRKNKFIVVLICIVVLTMLVSGCSKPKDKLETNTETTDVSDASASEGKSEIIIGVQQDATSLDPHAQNEIAAGKIMRLLYNRLTYVNLESGEIEGDLAESWEQVSDTEFKFKLHEGVKFHDGSDLTSKDVKFSLERARESARVKSYLADLGEIIIEDDYNITLTTKAPSAVFLTNLAHNGISIIPEGSGDDFGDNPIGTGPYKLVEHIPSDRIVIERFDDYFAGPTKTERFILRVIPEPSARVIALETGEIDIAEDIDPIDVEKVEQNKNLTLLQTPSVGMEYFGFNFNKSPYENLLVRQAFAHAINKQAIVDAVLNGQGVPAKTVVGTGVPGFYDGMEGFEYNPEKAKELLTEAGYPDGFDTTVYITGSDRVLTAQLIQSDLAEIGVNLEIEQFESSALFDAVNNGRQTTYILTWSNSTGDCHNSIFPVFHSSNHGATGNRMWYTNEKVDELIEEAVKEFDNDKRMELYKEVQELVVNDAPWIPLFHKVTSVGVNSHIKGLTLDPGSMHIYKNVYYE